MSMAQPILASGNPSRNMLKMGSVWMTSPKALKRTSKILFGLVVCRVAMPSSTIAKGLYR